MFNVSPLDSSIVVATAMLNAFSNPASVVKKDALSFQNTFPNQIVSLAKNGVKIRYAWSGNPNLRPIIFVHGSPGSWEVWAHMLMNKNLRNRFQVISVERPGYGNNNPGVAEPSLRKQAAAVMLSLKENKSNLPAIIIGHSFGGPVIARMVIDNPKNIAGLIFVSSSIDPQLEKIKWIQYPATWWPIRELIPSKLRTCNEEIFPLKAELINLLDKWKSVEAKTVIIHGEEDPLVPVSNVDFLTQHLNKEVIHKIHRIPSLNHFVPWQRPDLILDAINDLEGALP